MEYLIAFIIAFALAFWLGWKLREVYAMRIMNKFSEKYANNLAESFKKDVVDISVEHTNGCFFIYNRNDGTYLAHGESMSKLEDILSEKFPGKLFNATPEDLEKLKTQ